MNLIMNSLRWRPKEKYQTKNYQNKSSVDTLAVEKSKVFFWKYNQENGKLKKKTVIYVHCMNVLCEFYSTFCQTFGISAKIFRGSYKRGKKK